MPISKTVGDVTVTAHNEERQLCDVYSRVVGYFQPLSMWNMGKQSEWGERKLYSINEPAIIQQSQQRLDI